MFPEFRLSILEQVSMKIGYPCINLSLSCRSSRTFRLASFTEDRFLRTVDENLDCLMEILRFNAGRGLLFFRITSDLIPFASHPVCAVPWQRIFRSRFREIGNFIQEQGIRVSMHPDQFTLINSIDRKIFARSAAELHYHAEVLDLLGTDRSAKIQIHVGGVYGDKERSTKRFITRYQGLGLKIRKRLVIENDERLFNLRECMAIHRKTGIPVVFDVLHFRCNNSGEGMREALSEAFRTWSRGDGAPIIDYSDQEKKKRTGTHALTIDERNFAEFLREIHGLDADIMLEIKDKERSALRAARILTDKGVP